MILTVCTLLYVLAVNEMPENGTNCKKYLLAGSSLLLGYVALKEVGELKKTFNF